MFDAVRLMHVDLQVAAACCKALLASHVPHMNIHQVSANAIALGQVLLLITSNGMLPTNVAILIYSIAVPIALCSMSP